MQSNLRDDVKLTREHIQTLSSVEQLAAFFARLRYPDDARLSMTPEALQLNVTLTNATRRIERLTSVAGGALQVYLFELTSVTVAYTRALTRAFRNRAGNFLLVLTDDYERIDFVLLQRQIPEPGSSRRGVIVRPRTLSVDRRDPGRVPLRVLRRFTFTEYTDDGRRDPYGQWDKLSSAYTIAEWSEPLFNNRALFSDYYLNQRLPELDEWNAPERNRAFREIRGQFAQARRRFADADTAATRGRLIRPLLETLGFRVESGPGGDEPDFLLHSSTSLPGGGDAPGAFVLSYPWNRYLDGKDKQRDDERPEENPGAQVVALLEGGEADWGIVTNGKLWRLYSARAHSRATNYYEINLEETLASPDPGEPFRYFYLFFRAAAFVPPLGEGEGAFLDWLMEQSKAYARELGQRLKERVFEQIFPHFAEGFIQSLGGPEALLELDEKERARRLNEVYQGTLTFLYRLLFLLYAESRDLLPVREVRGYYQISLQQLKEEIAEQAGALEDQVAGRLGQIYNGGAEETSLYGRLLKLFAVIDEGSQAHNVPAYNGGLFITGPDEEDTGREAAAARFLKETNLPDCYLALGLDRLARDVDPKRGDLGFIDYKSLGVRQLGSIYEGLLEFHLAIDAESTGPGASPVHLVSDKGERKATGSYYTPDYIVKYIVRHTVGPVLDEKLDALRPRLQEAERRFRQVVKRKRELEGVTPDEPALLRSVVGDVLQDLFDVKILDPAMGSGHFLVEAVDYVTDRLVRFLDGFPFLGVFFEGMRAAILEEMERQQVTVDPARLTDVTLLKRHVLKRCIYGVDLNPMAVELAKVSLWLDCFTLGAPLSFLDHHLRCGNSLIGAMAQEVEEAMGGPTPEGQMTFLTGPFAGLLRAAEIMRGISTIADVTLEQVRESGHLFEAFDEAATPYKQLLDIHVAQHFGVERAKEFLTLYGAEAMEADPEELGKPYREVVERTRVLYEKKRFFHWDLEFPEVFIGLDQAQWKKDGGFDAVIGNPPYVSSRNEEFYADTKSFIDAEYESAFYQVDLYYLFMEEAANLISTQGYWSLIVPDTWVGSTKSRSFRSWLVSENAVLAITLSSEKIFQADVDCLVIVCGCQEQRESLTSLYDITGREPVWLSRIELPSSGEVFVLSRHQGLLKRIERLSFSLDDISVTGRGIGAYHHSKHSEEVIEQRAFHATYRKDDTYRPELGGGNISRYETQWDGGRWISYGEWLSEPRDPVLFEGERILCRKILAQNLCCTFTDKDWLVDQQVYVAAQFREDYETAFVASVLASRLIGFYARKKYHEEGLFPHLRVTQFRSLPIRRIHFTTPEAERERIATDLIARYERGEHQALLAEIEALLPKTAGGDFLAFQPDATGAEEKSDVVHDLLAHLAEQMIEMHKQKQERVAAFWDDLNAVTDAGTFGDLSERGKWEASLWKAPACRPYVDQESRSTRHLDESLGWDEDCYEAFAGLLAGKASVTGPIIDVYREHHLPYKALVERIASTDRLIDQIVYRLYGLTDEEIAVVEKDRE